MKANLPYEALLNNTPSVVDSEQENWGYYDFPTHMRANLNTRCGGYSQASMAWKVDVVTTWSFMTVLENEHFKVVQVLETKGFSVDGIGEGILNNKKPLNLYYMCDKNEVYKHAVATIFSKKAVLENHLEKNLNKILNYLPNDQARAAIVSPAILNIINELGSYLIITHTELE